MHWCICIWCICIRICIDVYLVLRFISMTQILKTSDNIPKAGSLRQFQQVKCHVTSKNINCVQVKTNLEGALSDLRTILAPETPFKMMKNAFCLTLKAPFILEIFTFLFWLFGNIGKRFDKKAKGNFKIYYIINWEGNN